MARAITMYEAHDGTRFNTSEAATQHEQLISVVGDAMATLPDPPDQFGNDTLGYWQQNPTLVMEARVRLVQLAAAIGVGHNWFREHLEKGGKPEELHPLGYAGRIMSECGPAPLKRAWSRLSRIDDQGREWEQPFFAINPEKGCQYPYGEEPAA